MNQSPSENPGKIGVINGLRGVAILAVVFYHITNGVVFHISHTEIYQWYGFTIVPYFFLFNGHQGVILFFVLSGFVLALPYASGRRIMSSSSILTFYWRRARRLLPLYAFFCAIGLLFVHPHNIAQGIFDLATFAFIFDDKTLFSPYNTVFWTLGYELWFSLLMPFILVGVKKYGISYTLIFALIIGVGLRCAMFLPALQSWPALTNNPLRQIDSFVCGIYLAYAYSHAFRVSPDTFWMGCIGVLAGMYTFTIFTIDPRLPVILQTQFWTLTELGLVLMIAGLLTSPRSILRKFLENRVLQMIGLMCYSIYLWHFILIAPLQPGKDILHFTMYIVALFALSLLTYRYIEFWDVKDLRKVLPSLRSSRSNS